MKEQLNIPEKQKSNKIREERLHEKIKKERDKVNEREERKIKVRLRKEKKEAIEKT